MLSPIPQIQKAEIPTICDWLCLINSETQKCCFWINGDSGKALVRSHPRYVSENSNCVCGHVKVIMSPRGARDVKLWICNIYCLKGLWYVVWNQLSCYAESLYTKRSKPVVLKRSWCTFFSCQHLALIMLASHSCCRNNLSLSLYFVCLFK